MHPIIEEIKGKKIAILGFGKEGQSTYAYIRKHLPMQDLTIADANMVDTQNLSHVTLQDTNHYQDLDAYDYIFKSPGIVLTQKYHHAILTSQTEMFLKYYGEQCVGITGTKGKSTTVSLLYHILQYHKKKAVLLGNIGLPAFDYLDEMEKDTIVVYELSCHQLEYTKFSPHIAVLLNIHEEHLDHYGTFEKYIKAKENVWRNQNVQDILVCQKQLYQPEMKGHVIKASMLETDADIYASNHQLYVKGTHLAVDSDKIHLLGDHNLYDIAIDVYLAELFGISYQDALEAVYTFHPLPHRLEYVGCYHNLHWYDDSISTIGETTIQALKSLPQTNTLLVGGMDRGIDYQDLYEYIPNSTLTHVILMPDSGYLLKDKLGNIPYTCVDDLKEAVEVAKQVTKSQGTVLLSPAAASYGFFKNFEERGMCYQNYIKEEQS